MLKTGMEIVTESWHLYLKNWRQYLPYLVILFVPTFVLSILGVVFIYLEILMPASYMASNIIILLLFAASLVLTIWGSIALTKAIAASLAGQTPAWKEVFSTSNHLIWQAIGTAILVILIVMLGLFLLLVPGIIFAVWYGFTQYAVVLDNARGMQALQASKALVVGRWWSIFWRFIVIGFMFGLLNVAINIIIEVLISLTPLAMFLQSALASLLTALAAVAITPFIVAGSIILYYNAKQNPIPPTTNPPQA